MVLDPGHNGGDASHPHEVNKLVYAGFGRSKACNTTGTETNAGFAEHRLNWTSRGSCARSSSRAASR